MEDAGRVNGAECKDWVWLIVEKLISNGHLWPTANLQPRQLAFLALLLYLVKISYWSKQLLKIGLSFFANASHTSQQTRAAVVNFNFLLLLEHWRNVAGVNLAKEFPIGL